MWAVGMHIVKSSKFLCFCMKKDLQDIMPKQKWSPAGRNEKGVVNV
jgi:hypothetical protein